MNTALNYLYYCYDKLIVFIFDTCDFGGGVTIGWILISVFVFNILISNILAVPTKSQGMSISKYKASRSNDHG